MKTYTVKRVYKATNHKHMLYADLTREEAENIVNISPDEDDAWIVFEET